jgi:phage FluMu protein Com
MGNGTLTTAESVAKVCTRSTIRWQEMRCARCGHLLQKVELEALRPGKRLEIKCVRCKMFNYLVGPLMRGGEAPHQP